MADTTKTDEVKAAEVAKAEADAKAAQDAAAQATADAQARDAETLKAQESMEPYPSQKQADAIKVAAATGSAPYVTRDTKAK